MSKSISSTIEKEGLIYKRGARMQRWASRYFVLEGSKLSYKAKQDSSTYKAQYDLVGGCVVTDIVHEANNTVAGGKLHTFWIVWPHDKHGGEVDIADDETIATISADAHENHEHHEKEAVRKNSSLFSNAHSNEKKEEVHADGESKNLKSIVETERKCRFELNDKVEQQIVQHRTHDNNIALGVKVAAIAVGGVVVGALTLGIGLIPYATVVGATALASGGAVAIQSLRRPIDSRIILATESLSEALSWKSAIEMQIARVVEAKRPALPPNIHIVCNMVGAEGGMSGLSSMYGLNKGSVWRRIGYLGGGVRVLEQRQEHPKSSVEYISYKAQVVTRASPIKTFLTLMDMQCQPTSTGTSSSGIFWPPSKYNHQHHLAGDNDRDDMDENYCKVIQVIDDHADVVGVSIRVIHPNDVDINSEYQPPRIIEYKPSHMGFNFYDPTEEKNIKQRGCDEEFSSTIRATIKEQSVLLALPLKSNAYQSFKSRIQQQWRCSFNACPSTKSSSQRYPLRKFCLRRFWKLDDDGTYLITYSITTHEDFPTKDTFDTTAGSVAAVEALPISIDTVITISPRRDADLYEEDIEECLVSCSIQVSLPKEKSKSKSDDARDSCGGDWVDEDEYKTFMLEYIQQIVDLKDFFCAKKYAPLEALNSGNPKRERTGSSASIMSASPIILQTQSHGKKNEGRSSKGSGSGVGIVTQQPGLDDEDALSINSDSNRYRSNSLISNKSNNSTSRKLFSGPSASNPMAFSVPQKHNNGVPTPSDNGNSSVWHDVPAANEMEPSVSSKKRRGSILKKANPELLTIRNNIQAKEYEIHRLQKMLKKHIHHADNVDVGNSVTNNSVDDLPTFFNQQCAEYHELLSQYYSVSHGDMYKPKSSVGKKILKKGYVKAFVPPATTVTLSTAMKDQYGSENASIIDAANQRNMQNKKLMDSPGNGSVSSAVNKPPSKWRKWLGSNGDVANEKQHVSNQYTEVSPMHKVVEPFRNTMQPKGSPTDIEKQYKITTFIPPHWKQANIIANRMDKFEYIHHRQVHQNMVTITIIVVFASLTILVMNTHTEDLIRLSKHILLQIGQRM